MKTFEMPVIEITLFAVADVVTVSGDFIPPKENENQTPYG